MTPKEYADLQLKHNELLNRLDAGTASPRVVSTMVQVMRSKVYLSNYGGKAGLSATPSTSGK